MKYPTMESDFVDAASTCQEPVKLNMALKLPSGVDPDIPDWSLKYSAIWNFDSNSLSETTHWSYQPEKNQDHPQEWTCGQGAHSWCKKDAKWPILYAFKSEQSTILGWPYLAYKASCKLQRKKIRKGKDSPASKSWLLESFLSEVFGVNDFIYYQSLYWFSEKIDISYLDPSHVTFIMIQLSHSVNRPMKHQKIAIEG